MGDDAAEQVPPEARSRVASYDWMGSTALRPVGLAIAGSIAGAFGVRETLIAAAAIVVAASAAISPSRMCGTWSACTAQRRGPLGPS